MSVLMITSFLFPMNDLFQTVRLNNDLIKSCAGKEDDEMKSISK